MVTLDIEDIEDILPCKCGILLNKWTILKEAPKEEDHDWVGECPICKHKFTKFKEYY